MIQIIDVSKDIMYDKEKAHTELLNLINATVSHEMRNPLNSIHSQNIENKALYEELEELIKDDKIDTDIFK
jgi:signal transduction histidine kinase